MKIGTRFTYNGQEYRWKTSLHVNGKLHTITTMCGKDLTAKGAKVKEIIEPIDPKEFIREQARRMGWPTKFVNEQ